MKNNKGFTIIELAVSFVLVATISIVLLQLVLSLKSVYLEGDIKTTLLNKQGIMTKYIYDDINNKRLKGVTSCGLSCLTLEYNDKTTKNLLVDPGNKTITYGEYTIQLDNSSYFGQIDVDIKNNENSVCTATSCIDDSIIKIEIPVKSKLLNDDDFGFNIVTTYNAASTTVDTSATLQDTIVTASTVDTKLKVLTDENNSTRLSGIFVNLFHQTNNSYFNNNFDDFIKNKGENTLSALKALNAFKTKKNVDEIIQFFENDSNLSIKEKTKIKESYQNGYYSLLLNYNNLDLSTRNYYWWYQTSNFASKESLTGFYVGFDEGIAPNGITYNKKDLNWANISGSKTNIGVKKIGNETGTLYDTEGNPATSVDLYVDAREYICKYTMSDVTYNDTYIKDLIMSDGTTLCE